MSLNNKQKKFLKSRAHSLKPVVIIGNQGLTDAVINETHLVLDTHELIKVKIHTDDRAALKQIANELTRTTDAQLVQIIGHIAIIYRQRRKKPAIVLP